MAANDSAACCAITTVAPRNPFALALATKPQLATQRDSRAPTPRKAFIAAGKLADPITCSAELSGLQRTESRIANQLLARRSFLTLRSTHLTA